MDYNGLAFPKGSSRVAEKKAKRAAEARAMLACYREVDRRDLGRCRVCRKRGHWGATSLLDKLHRHHMVYRSQGGEDTPENVLSVCAGCHAAIHVEGTLRVQGDANVRDAVTGKFCGVEVSRLTENGWQVERMC